MPAEDGEPSYESVYNGIKEYIGKDYYLQRLPVEVDGANGPSLPGYKLDVIVRDTFAIDGSEVNQCVEHITKGFTKIVWKGPIVIVREEKKTLPWGGSVGGKCEHLDVADIGPAIKYFQQYG